MKYHFEVEFQDGSTYKQTKEDVSKVDPKRNCFYDVLNSGKDIKVFTLKRLLDTWSINLKTGVFKHNGNEFQLEWNIKPQKRELYYMKNVERDFNANYNTEKKINSIESGAVRIIYFLGYKTKDKEYIVGIK